MFAVMSHTWLCQKQTEQKDQPGHCFLTIAERENLNRRAPRQSPTSALGLQSQSCARDPFPLRELLGAGLRRRWHVGIGDMRSDQAGLAYLASNIAT